MATTLRECDLAIFDALAIVTVRGFRPAEETVTDPETGLEFPAWPMVDLPGDANWLVGHYGYQIVDPDPQISGILHTDYDSGCDDPWRFSVLIASDEVEDFRRTATEAGYEVVGTEEIAEPTTYGDGSGTVTILRHPDGWCLAV